MSGAFLIHVEGRGYLYRNGGMVFFSIDPNDADTFATKEEAHDMRPGHHRDMGGSGFVGRVYKAKAMIDNWRAYRERQNSQSWGRS